MSVNGTVEGVYLGPAGQLVLIDWSDGPGWNTGGWTYTTDGMYFLELSLEACELMEGYEYLGEL